MSQLWYFAARIFVGCTFCYAGMIKLFGLSAFYLSIQNLGLLPEAIIPAFAVAVCLFEISLGFSLLVGFSISKSAFGISIVLLIFTGVQFNAMLTDTIQECGCFGEGSMLDWWSVGRNVLLLSISVSLLRPQRSILSIDSWRAKEHSIQPSRILSSSKSN